MRKAFLIVSILLLTAGCAKDVRIKRAASFANVKMSTEASEYKAATTPEEKLRIADRHFETMPKFTQVLDDYLQGRNPKGPTPEDLKSK